jgi:hypothetical protein
MCNSCQTSDNHAQGYATCEAHPQFAGLGGNKNKGIIGEVDGADSGEQRA